MGDGWMGGWWQHTHNTMTMMPRPAVSTDRCTEHVHVRAMCCRCVPPMHITESLPHAEIETTIPHDEAKVGK